LHKKLISYGQPREGIIEFLDNKLEKEIDKTSFCSFFGFWNSLHKMFVFISVEVKDEIRLYIRLLFNELK
jgi:succinate-acetate transporter protein